jgi:hypothetical protein
MSILIRRQLLGLEGPYADPRSAIDPLDNFKLWIVELAHAEQRLAFESLMECAIDADIQVATGAILALDFLAGTFDSTRVVSLLTEHASALQRAPQGFAAAYCVTLFEELFDRLVQYAPVDLAPRLESLMVSSLPPTRRSTLLVSLATRFPQLVVYHARQCLDPHDVQVLAALPEHWQRIAVAGALRPWTKAAIARVEPLWQIRKVNPSDAQAIIRVMLDQSPLLTHPPGLTDPRRWWIIAAEPYGWTVWEAEDGRLALETMRPGPSFTSDTRYMTPQQESRFRELRAVSRDER